MTPQELVKFIYSDDYVAIATKISESYNEKYRASLIDSYYQILGDLIAIQNLITAIGNESGLTHREKDSLCKVAVCHLSAIKKKFHITAIPEHKAGDDPDNIPF